MAGMLGVQRGDLDLVGQRGGHLGDFLELLVRVAQHGLQLDGILRFVAQQFVARAQIRRGRREILDADAPQSLDQHARGAVGKFHHLGQARHAADLVQILGRGFGHFGLALQHRAEQAVAGHDVVNQLQARPGFDEQRHDRAGKNHDVRQAEDGQGFRQRTRRNARRRVRFFGGAQNADKFCLRRCHRRFQHLSIRCRRTGKDSRAANFLRQSELWCFWSAIDVPGGTSIRRKPFT